MKEIKFPYSGTKTQKLISLIEVAMNAPAILPGRPLNFKISGDVIELQTAGGDINDEDLRLATINCGLVLSFIQKAIEEQNYMPVIQTFPNVSEPQLMAFIRIEKKNSVQEFPNRLPYAMDAMIDDDGSNSLKRMFMDENITLHEVTSTEGMNQIIDECQHMRVDAKSRTLKKQNLWNLSFKAANDRSELNQDLDKVWLVSTNADNAISWLSIGKVLGKLFWMCSSRSIQFHLDVNLLENAKFRKTVGQPFSTKGYTQFLLKPTYYK